MATIKIKRSTTTGASAPVDAGEISVNLTDNQLFIGNGSSAVAYGGSGSFCALSGNQTIAGDKTFSGTTALGSATATTPSASDSSTNVATTAFVSGEITTAIGGLASAFEYKGTIDASGGTEAAPSSIEADKYGSDTEATGDYYKVSAAGYLKPTTAGAASTGFYVNANDSIVFNGTDWDVIDNTNSTVASSGASITVSGSADEGFNVEVASVDGGTF